MQDQRRDNEGRHRCEVPGAFLSLALARFLLLSQLIPRIERGAF